MRAALAIVACISVVPRAHGVVSTAPSLKGHAHIADGTSAKPYQALVKDCYPFSVWDSELDFFWGYHIDQMNTLHSEASPFRVNYTRSNTTYDGTLELLE